MGRSDDAQGKQQQLSQIGESVGEAVSHRVHRTRPGAVGGVICAPPFCNGGSLPAVLPGDSAANAARELWSNQQM